MAEVLALVAAFSFAVAATLQQKGALGMGEVSLGSPSSFVLLARQKFWLIGTISLLVGYALQAAALERRRRLGQQERPRSVSQETRPRDDYEDMGAAISCDGGRGVNGLSSS